MVTFVKTEEAVLHQTACRRRRDVIRNVKRHTGAPVRAGSSVSASPRQIPPDRDSSCSSDEEVDPDGNVDTTGEVQTREDLNETDE